ncbi:MAG TPA: hypothetical protein VN030_03715, partial [Cellvibrio sp.]|nr:hypothetical protein [Cellvibrio sp.]
MENSFLAVERPGLFRSSAWLRAWGKAWLDHPAVSWCGPAQSDASDLPVEGISAGIYTTSETLMSFFPVQNAYPFGASCKSVPAIRSEYFQFPMSPEANPRWCEGYLKNALSIRWDRFVFSDVLVDSPDHKSILAAARLQKLSTIKGGVENTYGVNLQGKKFLDYVKGLGKN